VKIELSRTGREEPEEKSEEKIERKSEEKIERKSKGKSKGKSERKTEKEHRGFGDSRGSGGTGQSAGPGFVPATRGPSSWVSRIEGGFPGKGLGPALVRVGARRRWLRSGCSSTAPGGSEHRSHVRE
jgi:hypothetical protein